MPTTPENNDEQIPANADTSTDPAAKAAATRAANAARERRFSRVGFWITFGSAVLAVVSLGFGYYWYRASQLKPNLTFTVSPVVTELKRPDFDPDFKFAYKGKEVQADNVTSIQIAVWNNGNKAIKEADVLDPVKIKVGNSVQVLSVHIKKQTRSVCYARIVTDDKELHDGSFGLKWRILEPEDGMVIQVIFVGPSHQSVEMSGAIEGQKTIGGIETPKEDSTLDWSAVLFLIALAVLFALIRGKEGLQIVEAAKSDPFVSESVKHVLSYYRGYRLSFFTAVATVLVIVILFRHGINMKDRLPFAW